MSTTSKKVIMTRVYLSEESHTLDDVMDYLKGDANISGYTVFRAIKGMGSHGEKASRLLDISLDLPIVIEFFDEKTKVDGIIEHLNTIVPAYHIVFWEVNVNTP